MNHHPIYPPSLSRQNLGTLIVQVASDPLVKSLVPISDILVSIKEVSPSGDATTIAEFNTNEVGQTPPIELSCPPVDYSLDPLNTEKPYSTFRIETSSKDYIDSIIIGSQVFTNTSSIQPITLTPISSLDVRSTRDSSTLTETTVIGPARLYGNYPEKVPELAIKPIIPGSGFVVLDSVVVPEFIIVHDGDPNNPNAANYTVTFKDYIANVVSSEIYPTWPTETIAANVIAITSFALNRVFTEWYRNQGKSFTITNSTAFDQAFFNGRNIFDSVIPIVNSYFDTYIRKGNVKQPLLSQYCDGVQSQCPGWMTQWGSQQLGESGFNAEQILRNFYGSDIILSTAPEVEGIPSSYPGKALRLGDSGEDVRTIQTQLNRISQNFPLIQKVAVTGEFDKATEDSVKTFQKIFHLVPDGIVGKSTWYEISRIYVAVTRIAEIK